MLEQVSIVAPTASTVLLHGETGTGKELIARAIHNLSSRRDRTFVRMNCAAIPSGLLESELFGHERGAFTGALIQKKGRFELADEGSLFLDEIGDISLELQPKLLRAVQEQEFERLGSAKTIQVDVRMIAATHRDLPTMIRDGQFREDLFYRLNVFPIEIPPLRERRDDIPLLVHYFVSKLSRRMKKEIKTIPRRAMDALTNNMWPGNVRELANFIERAVIVTRGEELQVPISELRSANRVSVSTVSNNSTFAQAETGGHSRSVKSCLWKNLWPGRSGRNARPQANDSAEQNASPRHSNKVGHISRSRNIVNIVRNTRFRRTRVPLLPCRCPTSVQLADRHTSGTYRTLSWAATTLHYATTLFLVLFVASEQVSPTDIGTS